MAHRVYNSTAIPRRATVERRRIVVVTSTLNSDFSSFAVAVS